MRCCLGYTNDLNQNLTDNIWNRSLITIVLRQINVAEE